MPRKKAELRREPDLIIQAIVQGMLEKKAKNPVVLDFSKLNHAVCDAFIICHGTSRPQVEAIADEVIREVKKRTGEIPWHKEGLENAEWILIDYINVVVHIFQELRRNFYNLEQLWGDARIEKIESP
ncbi:MAG: ribosome silencing factor [Bacteroidetes bacterium]|nr:MAG: ribosome silencing factor [Bacteroidota bacterium]